MRLFIAIQLSDNTKKALVNLMHELKKQCFADHKQVWIINGSHKRIYNIIH